MAHDLTTEILVQIRDGIAGMREDFNSRFAGLQAGFAGLQAGFAGLQAEFAALREETGTRFGRVEHGLNDLGKFMRQIALDQTKYERFHAHHVEVLEKDVEDLRGRVRRLEER